MPIPRTCPQCGDPAPAAIYRPLKTPAPLAPPVLDPREFALKKFVSIGRAYCPRCDLLLPREETGANARDPENDVSAF